MLSASSSSSELETADDASVEHAALAYQRVRREHALQRYLKAREAYEVACIARERRQLVLQSHNHTLRLLEGVVGDVKAVVDATLKEGLSVRESTVTAAEMLLASSCYKRAERGLVTLLAHEGRQHEALQAATPPPTETSLIPQVFSPGSRADKPVASSSEKHMLRPLLLLCEWRLDYTTLLCRQRLPLFSELARAQRLIHNSSESARVARRRAHAPTAPIAQRCQLQVAEARASLAKARASQRSLKDRLHQLHQMLSRSAPVHAESGVFVDAGVAEEIQAQLRREIAVGRVTLLRILCENLSGAFDEKGRLTAL
ncbi:hypothetical protein conserved [Leishmania donovani]|uniref:Uncharacterized protein n=3 Tax=Leishmania donovani species complex TaxID=38574 RepID=E9AHD4_LEIIN|nr:hypothetical protein, unknown function [Leishmania infantum JPCM5]AYU79943.1 hypothetical protein LdCL_270011300 [Leishmania donovani]CAC9499022.1 hypothetical_protein_-_conserved [Leishmania infantum]TPP46130.1 hypothetical protein CGC20_33070 [Leishmania donovani]TPP47589.1 hypothetical protein CGC21_31155 [Leishmania donovani]CAJ1989928.1 hypothetical protein conserved [Leishmania donovani]|eukprot:XP_003392635.1 hypothetical protein, unknown function [Leishmania infantum JPCM5]